jgi:hypothetical protein
VEHDVGLLVLDESWKKIDDRMICDWDGRWVDY